MITLSRILFLPYIPVLIHADPLFLNSVLIFTQETRRSCGFNWHYSITQWIKFWILFLAILAQQLQETRGFVCLLFFFFLSNSVEICCHSLTSSCLESSEATTPSNFPWSPHPRLNIGFIVYTRALWRVKKDANENYAGTICLKSPEETGHITTLLMLFIVS